MLPCVSFHCHLWLSSPSARSVKLSCLSHWSLPSSSLWLSFWCHRQMEYKKSLSMGVGWGEEEGNVPQSGNLSNKWCDSRHGVGDSWKIAVNSPWPGCAQGDGILRDIIKACGNTAQSPRRPLQDTSPLHILVTFAKPTLLETESVLVLAQCCIQGMPCRVNQLDLIST